MNRASDRLAKAFDHPDMRKHHVDEWFRDFLKDIMAGFGRKLNKPWSAYKNEHLFRIGQLYAELISENPPFTDILGTTYENLAGHWGRKSFAQFFTPQSLSGLVATALPKNGQIITQFKVT